LPFSNKQSKIRELQGPRQYLIISNDEQNQFSPLITILPFTSSTDKIYPFQVLTELKGRNSVILVDQIRTFDRKRFGAKIGEASIELMEEVEKALHITLALER
jgi:mRNA interferase MazF